MKDAARILLTTMALASCASAAQAFDPWNSATITPASKGQGMTVTVVDRFPPVESHGGKMEIVIGTQAPLATLARWEESNYTLPVQIGGTGVKVVNYSYGVIATGVSNAMNQSLLAAAQGGTAVVAKAGGNATTPGGNYASTRDDPFNVALGTSKSGLIVGALDRAGSVADPASLGAISVFAGPNKAVQSRFLVVDSGGAKYLDQYLSAMPLSVLLKNDFTPEQIAAISVQLAPYLGKVPAASLFAMVPGGDALLESERLGHTSQAAATISGYAAVIGGRFKNATPEQVSNRLLATARQDTVKNYDPAIYGRGEASLSRAMAPNRVR